MTQKIGILSLFQQDFRLKLFVKGTLVGTCVGFLIVAFRIAIEKSSSLRSQLYELLKVQEIGMTFLWFLVLMGIGLLLSLIVAKVPMSGGSGIPQVKGVLLGRWEVEHPAQLVLGKFIGGILGIGGGLSLGREGPSIQLGASLSQILSKRIGRLKIEEKYLITCGASAGLAAAFNAPLAGVVFALEELHKNFSPAVLISAMAASLSADVVAQNFMGQRPTFHFETLAMFPLNSLIFLIGLGILCGVFGAVFNWSLVKTLNLYAGWKIPKILHPMLPLLTAGGLGFILPEVLGGGNDLVNALGGSPFTIRMGLIFFVVKFLFTMLSYGSGVPGGIFLPLLVLGSLLGNLYGQFILGTTQGNPALVNNYTVYAMAAAFTAIVKAPVTGSILITEMTGSFHHLLPLIFVSMTSYIVSDLLKSKPVYDLLYERSLSHDEKGISGNEEKGESGKARRDIYEVVVCLGSSIVGKKVKEIAWPNGCLLVSIKRGDLDLIPKGNTVIEAGDYLFALASKENVKSYDRLIELTTDDKRAILNIKMDL